jgi:hypothetical protein
MKNHVQSMLDEWGETEGYNLQQRDFLKQGCDLENM